MAVAAITMLAQAPALAAPTAEEIAAARADCRMHRERYEELKVGYQPPPPPSPGIGIRAESLGVDDLSMQYDVWQRSCDYAERLMHEAKMERPAARPPPPRFEEMRPFQEPRVEEPVAVRPVAPEPERPRRRTTPQDYEPSVGGTKARHPEPEPAPQVVPPAP